MRQLRPVLTAPHEAPIMMRLCADEALAAARGSTGERPLTAGEIITNWDEDFVYSLLARYRLRPEEAIEVYEAAADDAEAWVSDCRLYQGAVDAIDRAVASDAASVVVLTTRPRASVQTLLRRAGVRLDDDAVYGRGSGPKAATLAALRARHPDASLAFVDDRVATLRAVANDVGLFSCELYFAGWGYSTAQQQATIAAMPRVRDLGVQSEDLARALSPPEDEEQEAE